MLCQAMEIGVKDPSASPKKVGGKKVIDPSQKNTLDGFFGLPKRKAET